MVTRNNEHLAKIRNPGNLKLQTPLRFTVYGFSWKRSLRSWCKSLWKLVELNHQSHKQKLHCAKKRNIADALKFVSKGFLVNSIRLRLDYVTRKALAARNNEAKGLGKFSVVSCQKPITSSVQLPYLVWATVFSHIFSTIFEHFFSRKWRHCFICVRMYDNYKKKKQMRK